MDNKLKIINYLGKNLGNSFTMHELSKHLKIPYATFYRTIKDMKDLIKIKPVGKANILLLNKENPTIKSYLVISSEEEKKEFLTREPILNKISTELKTKDIVLLFGSYAKGTKRENSDIDILVINEEGNRAISFSKYELLFKKKINSIFVAKSEFIQMLKDKEENVGKQALNNHIVLNNPEDLWMCVLNGKENF